jgi:hypothetical protein
MKNNRLFRFVIVAVSIFSIVGCAQMPDLGSILSRIDLRYSIPEGTELKYQLTSSVDQRMEMMGQPMKFEIVNDFIFNMTSKGMHGDALQLDVEIASADLDISSSMGSMSPDVSRLVGEGFLLSLSPQGRELNLSGARSLNYDLGQAGQRNLLGEFQAFFPDLPDRTVLTGDSWTSKDTVNLDQSDTGIQMLLNKTNTMAGLETYEGMECIKVNSEVTGRMIGTGNQNGADLEFSGDISSQETWYFAYKKGTFASYVAESVIDGNIDISGPMNASMPMTMQIKTENRLLP